MAAKFYRILVANSNCHNSIKREVKMNILFLFVLLFGLYVQAGILEPNVKEEISNRISLQGLRDIKNNLETELKSLVSPVILPFRKGSIEPGTSKNDLVILPSNLLTSEIFEKLGLDFLNEDSFSFTLNGKELKIPKDFKNIFLFNTTDSLSIPSSKHHNFARFISQSIPFNLPEYMNLMNYYLVLPKTYLSERLNLHLHQEPDLLSSNCTYGNSSYENAIKDIDFINPSSIYSRSILETSILDLPIFRSIITDNKPLMVFMFKNSHHDKFENFKNPIMSIKNYLSAEKSLISNFFDNFAQKWIKSVNYDSLVSSMFCTTNSNSLNDSYCLQIRDKKALYLFPAFKNIAELVNLEKEADGLVNLEREVDLLDKRESLDDEVSTQTLRQVHDKLSVLADKFNDVTYELATQPKPVIERVDERLDQKRYKFHDKVDAKKDDISDKKDTLKDGIMEKINVIKSKLGVIENFKSDDYDLGDNPYNVKEDNLIAKRFLEPEEGLALPLSLLREAEETLDTGRSKQYSQVIFPDHENNKLTKRFSIFSKDEVDCEKITWYNVFHHSIFGKPKFCLDN